MTTHPPAAESDVRRLNPHIHTIALDNINAAAIPLIDLFVEL